MTSTIQTPPPCEFGAPSKYTKWRTGQDEIFLDVIDSKKRISIYNCPTGAGKSLVYMTAALAQGKRVVVLTESKILMDQLQRDFGAVGLFDMRGLQNYTCKALSAGGEFERMWLKRWGKPSCEVGPCTAGIRCDLKNDGCTYFDDWRKACSAQLVSTNYAYWIAIHKYGQGLGRFQILICDECHVMENQLSNALSVEFESKDFKELGTKPLKITAPMQSWRMWARVNQQRITSKLDFYTQGGQVGQVLEDDGSVTLVQDTDIPDASELKYWKLLEKKCLTLSESSDDWIVDKDEHTHNIRIAPAWVRQYTEDYLLLHTKRVIMMSATVRPKIAELLGLKDDQWEFKEYPSTFPVERRPIYWVPTVRLHHDSKYSELRRWVVRIDQLLGRRLDRKGIIHTTSFKLQQFLLAYTQYRHIMYANVSGNTREIVKAFCEADAPAVLVSPSISTGFDFAFDLARFNIIGKIPFRDPRGAILVAKAAVDPDYLNYLTAQDLVQQAGRSTRDECDFSEVICVDDNIEWFSKRTDLFPEYFLEALQTVNGPFNPPSLEEMRAILN